MLEEHEDCKGFREVWESRDCKVVKVSCEKVFIGKVIQVGLDK